MLSRRWLFIYVILILAVLVGGGWFFRHEEQQIRHQVTDQLESIAQLKIHQIQQWRAERLGDAQVLVDAPFAAEIVSQWLEAPTPETTNDLIVWFQSLQKNYQYSDVLLLDAQGKIRLRLAEDSGPIKQEIRDQVEEAAKQHKAQMTDLHKVALHPPHQDVISPLFGGKGKTREHIGTILLRINASTFLYPMLQSWPVESGSAETLLVRRVGESVLFLNDLRHQRDSALQLSIPILQHNLPAAMAVGGREGIVDGLDYRNVQVIAVGYPVKGTDWYMISKVDTAEALAAWNLHAIYIATLVVGAILVLTTGLAVIWQRSRKEHYKLALQAEVERRRIEARYRTILLSVGDGVIVCDGEGRVQLLNPVAEVLTGWIKDDAMGRPIEEVFHIVHEETGQPVENPVHRVLREGIIVGLANHTSLITPDDVAYPIADSGAPIFDEQGQVSGVVLVFRDQSEERLVAAKLMRTANLLERAEEMADMGCWEFDFNTKIVWASPSARRIYGLGGETWTIDEIQGVPLPEYRMVLNRALKALVHDHAPYDVEFRIRRPSDGVLVDIRSQAEYNPEAHKIFGIIQDITQQKRAASEILESESRYRSLFQNNHAVMLLVDPDTGRVLDANPAAVDFYGWSREELLKKSIGEINTLTAEEIQVAMGDAQTDQRHTFAFRHRLADGSTRDVEVISGSILIGGQEQLYSIVQDVSGRRQAEEQRERLQEQLLQAQKLESVGRLAGGVAHDLNNLLSPILGYSEVLQADLPTGSVHHGYVETVHQAALRARDLVRQLLAFGRKQTLLMETVDLNQIVRSFVPLLRRTIREDIRIDLSLSPAADPVRVDVGQIEQVIMNLVVNAQDAMPEGGAIMVETEAVVLDRTYADSHSDVQPGPHVQLTVSDTGCGMSDEVRAQIFNPFYTTKEDGQGTGLGLATTYGIIKQHGGHIWVYSELDQGATFKIYLPTVDVGGHCPLEESQPMEENRGAYSGTVMVVEDNAMVRELAVDVLSRVGYTVLSAESGGECLQQLRGPVARIDLLLSDVVMPHMNGKELYKQASAQIPGLKVLYMSGYTENVIASRGVLDEGIQFIQKPFTPKALVAKVQEIINPG
ncbi:MAG: PAS domain S-box protein [Desulfobulbus sp.]|nr:PAS domain S-box protein [Desulfobulbus sp.]